MRAQRQGFIGNVAGFFFSCSSDTFLQAPRQVKIAPYRQQYACYFSDLLGAPAPRTCRAARERPCGSRGSAKHVRSAATNTAPLGLPHNSRAALHLYTQKGRCHGRADGARPRRQARSGARCPGAAQLKQKDTQLTGCPKRARRPWKHGRAPARAPHSGWPRGTAPALSRGAAAPA